MPNGYTFGGQHIHNFGCEMTGKEVPITPPFTNLAENQGGRDGGWDFGIQYEPKIIPVDHYIWTSDRATTQNNIRNLAGIMNPRLGAKPLIFDDEPDKMYYARLNEQINVDQILKLFNDFSLSFICYDPFTYSVTEYSPVITTSGVINHLGTHVSRPTLIVDHKGGDAQITCTPSGGSAMTVDFASDTPTGIFTIDMKEGTVLLGAGPGDKYIESIKWFEMAQGNNTITHTANINSVTVKYRHTWL